MATFKVDDVQINRERITRYQDDFTVADSIVSLVKGNLPEAYGCNHTNVVPTYANGFITALNEAYASHYPLILSPDDIWLTIAQSVAMHIGENPESLRKHFVAHEGKVKLVWHNDSLIMGSSHNNWMDGFDYFSREIKKHIGKKHDLLVSDFTTTGPIEKAASEVVLMDAMKHYFSYGVMTACGIPEITLLGTTEDWTSIRNRVSALGELEGLGPWTATLDGILAEFVAASKGTPNKTFWKSLYKEEHMGSGNPLVSGWANSLFLYLKGHKGLKLNPMAVNPSGRRSGSTSDFPSGISKVPFEWDYHGSLHKYEFLGGFVGCGQDPETFAVRPSMGWAVRAES